MENNTWDKNKKFYGSVILLRLERIEKYYSEFLEFISSQLIDLNNKIDQLNNESDETNDIDSDYYADDYFCIKNIEYNFNKSILISLYSLIEYNLKYFCNKASLEHNVKKYQEPRNNIVINSQIFLHNNIGIKLSNDSEYFIKILNIIRNNFTHSNGSLKDEDKIKIINKYLKKYSVKGIEIKENNIQISLEFIEYCIQQTKKYFYELIK